MTEGEITVVPANEATCEDLEAISGTSDVGWYLCQRFKIRDKLWSTYSRDALAERLREQACCDDPESPTTTGPGRLPRRRAGGLVRGRTPQGVRAPSLRAYAVDRP